AVTREHQAVVHAAGLIVWISIDAGLERLLRFAQISGHLVAEPQVVVTRRRALRRLDVALPDRLRLREFLLLRVDGGETVQRGLVIRINLQRLLVLRDRSILIVLSFG